ncbi:MAG: sirohydrochlorin chelatase [Burkholderiaceae bacterium]
MSMNSVNTGVVLFAHGSRDPLWRLPVEAVAQQMQRTRADLPVCCAYLELCEPDLPTAAAQLLAEGCNAIRIVPLFLGVGKHAREDLPMLVAALRQQHPQVAFALQSAVGEDPRLIALMAELAMPAEPA